MHREFIFLRNPVSSVSIKLPPLDLKPDQDISIFMATLLSPPSNPGSVVLVFDSIVEYFIFCKIGDNKWTKIHAKETGVTSNPNLFLCCSPLNYKGRCYVTGADELKVIDQFYICSATNPETEVNQMISMREVKQGVEKKQIETEKREDEHILEFLPDKREAEVGNIIDLPFETIALIAENLYLVDYMNFRLTCKTFGSVAPHIRWRESTSYKLQSHSLPPWLMVADKGNSSTVHTFIDPNLGGRYLINVPECLIGYDIQCSKDGWLLMSPEDEDDSMFFYNPFIKKRTPVPLGSIPVLSFGFWSSPTSHAGCMVVGISLKSISWFCVSRMEDWDETSRNDYPNFIPTDSTPVYFNEALYFLGEAGNLEVFRFEESNNQFRIKWKVYETHTKPYQYSCDHSYLLECDGNLFAVFVDNLGENIEVYQLNMTSMAWCNVRDIGNYMFFVSSSSSFSMVAKTPGMENKIYFPKIKGKEIVYYRLRKCKYRTFGSEQVAANFYNTTEYSHSAWIQQRWL
ncbi:hypothetical protein PTKIN_Ptkin11bG0181100 [Pterospermum kingtungense]